MALSKALVRWKPVTWSQLPETVEQALSENSIGAK
jgi:hypothetical protein